MANPTNDERLPTSSEVEREARRLERLRRLRLVDDDDREPERRVVLVPDFDPGPQEAA